MVVFSLIIRDAELCSHVCLLFVCFLWINKCLVKSYPQSFLSFFFFFGSAGYGTQGLAPAGQVLCH